jgi:ribosomal protein L7/L12
MSTTQQIPTEVLATWDRGDKIEAIRALRETTGLGLKEAKDALESGAYAVRVPGVPQPHGPVPADAAAALKRGDKIEAIKLMREASGLGLKEAKAAVEALTGEAVDPAAFRKSGLAPGEVPRGALNWARIITLFGIVIVMALVAYRLLRT